MKYYEVKAKCGHVGKNNYIIKNFYVRADSGKEAARKIRYAPRVKHHAKDAILNVEDIRYEEYIEGIKEKKKDAYFASHSHQEQSIHCGDLMNQIFKEEKDIKSKKKSCFKRHLLETARIREWENQLSYSLEY